MVHSHRVNKLTADILAGSHHITSDVAEALGGSGSALDPHELLEAALAACTTITLQMYANRQGWNLESADVKIVIDKEGSETHLQREIALRGGLTPEQIQRLLEIAEKCPIHKLLTSHITITTVTAVA